MIPVRLACWPASVHDYMRSLYTALEMHGVHLAIDGVRFEDAFLREYRGQFDALHIHWAEQLWGGGVLAAPMRLRGIVGLVRFLSSAKAIGVPIVWTAHNLRPHEAGDVIDTLGLWRVARMADLTLCHDRLTFYQLNAWPYRRRGSTVMLTRIGNFDLVWPPRPDATAAREGFGVRPDERVLLGFGAMRPYKGFDLAIEAMRLLDKRYRLVIAGPVTDQEYLNKMQELARGLPSVTILPRRIDDHELVRWLAAADCVLLPYRAITGSAALLGAVTAHRGVVASDLPFFHDTLSLSPGTGVLCEREDARALAEGIHQFFLMPPSDRCIAAARLSAMHDWLQIVEPIASWLKANAG